MSIDPGRFRQAMGRFASGVTVVTTARNEQTYGVTASAFASLSLDPPLVLVCLAKSLGAHRAIEESGVFAVNMLGAHQLDFGLRFAGLDPEVTDRFLGIGWRAAASGAPLLPDCLAFVDCRLWNVYDGGDHSIFVGEVQDAGVSDHDQPLLYHNRLWRRGLSGG
jgi:flavin reductase (DIM6/NTAB) family NADH-FMN oxidoreductase RutF